MSSLFRKPAEPEADGPADAPARGAHGAAAALASARTGLLTMAGRVSALAARKSAVAEADGSAVAAGGDHAAPGSQTPVPELAAVADGGGATLEADGVPSAGGRKTAGTRIAKLMRCASRAAAAIWAAFLVLCRLPLRPSRGLVRIIARRRGRTEAPDTAGKLPARRGSYLRLAKALLKLGMAAAAVLAVGAGIGYILQLMNPLIR